MNDPTPASTPAPAPAPATVSITIDGRAVDAREGESVIAAAKRAGVPIPHFCWHDKLSVAGSCRMCLVKVVGLPKLQPACNLVAAPKLAVETDSEEVRKARGQVLQFILLNHPVDCGICDKAGECTLQDEQFRHGAPTSRSAEPKLHKRKLHDLSPRITLDNERCILCSRCVRFTREISKSNALGIVERGHHAFVERLDERPFDDPYSDNVIGICPTGALLSRDFLYTSRVWFLEPVRSACPGCERACSLQAWRRKATRQSNQRGAEPVHTAYRITALENPAINSAWLCNKGFDQHKAQAAPRVLQARVDGRDVPTAEALATAARVLAGAKHPALLLSAQASNEELDACAAAFAGRGRAYHRPETRPAPGEVLQDELLIRADKNPNRAGLLARFEAAPFDAAAFAAAGHDAVLLWGAFEGFAAPAGVPVVQLAGLGEAAAAATMVIPVATHFERRGHFTNFAGVESRFEAVFAPPPGVLQPAEVFARCAP